MHREVVERHVELDFVVQHNELAGDARLVGVLDQRLAPLRLLDFRCALEQSFQVAVFVDELGGRFDADARHARHIIDAVASQCLHLDDLVRRHAEFLDHLRNAKAAILHGVVHGDAIGHQLHQILVRGYDGGGGAALAGLPHVSGD